MAASRVTFANKTQQAAYEAAKLNAQDVNEIKQAVNNNADELDKKVDKVGGTIPLDQLPPVYISGMSGSGTEEDPYIVANQVDSANYLRSLPNWAPDRVLLGNLTWVDPPTAGTPGEKLADSIITTGTATDKNIPLFWTAVNNGNVYTVQRDISAGFSSPVNVYSGPLLTFNDSNLTSNTTYYYRLRVTASGYTGSDYTFVNKKTDVSTNIVPPAPTSGVVNDIANTFDWTNSGGYPTISDYEYTINGGSTFQTVSVKPLNVGDVDLAAGRVGISVKAASGRDQSTTLFSATAFTKSSAPPLTTPATPTGGVVDDAANTFNWTNTPGYTSLNQYEYTVNGGASYNTVTVKPLSIGDIAKAINQVGVRVKAVVGTSNSSATLFNNAAFTTAAPPVDSSIPATLWRDESNATQIDSNSWKFTTPAAYYGFVYSNYKIPEGASGYVQMDVLQASGYVSLVNNANGMGVHQDPGAHMWAGGNGEIISRVDGVWSDDYTGGKPMGSTTKFRIRLDATSIHVESSVNNGVTWVLSRTRTRLPGDLFLRLAADVDQVDKPIHNVRIQGFEVW